MSKLKISLFMKIASALSGKQKKQWNDMRTEMWLLSNKLMAESQRGESRRDVQKLHALISEFPLFHDNIVLEQTQDPHGEQ